MEATTKFFEALNHRPPDPLLSAVRGTIRFELTHDGQVAHWLLVISSGNVSANQMDRPADCTIRTELEFFHRLADGSANWFAALLRSQVILTGDPSLYTYLYHLVPPPPNAHDPRDWVRQRRRAA